MNSKNQSFLCQSPNIMCTADRDSMADESVLPISFKNVFVTRQLPIQNLRSKLSLYFN